MAKPEFELYTDGSCPMNDSQSPGGWAYITRHTRTGSEQRFSGYAVRTTNNRMELTAVIEGLKSLGEEPTTVLLCSDSEYVIFGISKWLRNWKRRHWLTTEFKTGKLKPVKNPDLWQEVDRLVQIHEVEVAWTRGHVGHPENEWCDKAAATACREGSTPCS